METESFEIVSAIGSIATAVGVLFSLLLVIIPALSKKYKERKNALLSLNGIVIEFVVFIRNYFVCSHEKYQIVVGKGDIRIKFKEIEEFKPNINIYSSIAIIEKESRSLNENEQEQFMQFALKLRNIFSGWAVNEEKWIDAYKIGVNIINKYYNKNCWDLKFQEDIFGR